ncbi:uncharacterized protein LOC119793278 [Cyprinodon tularosa]|uniref:uncharacterized protein LOC119793278 n=1 Tax=Cyprinodon tularosa TaxID=77115 RepID=UPI0018E210A4|nr:uncharacterized protein LOC119793278 [Cyprinodon tularosa]
MAAEMSKERVFMIVNEGFRKNADTVIREIMAIREQASPEIMSMTSGLMDELLHGLIFLGKIRDQPCSPEAILGKGKTYLNLKTNYPEAFETYSTHLPRRSPFSVVLEMVVKLKGQNNDKEIRETLQDIILKIDLKNCRKLDRIFSSTLCVSHAKEDSKKYYGVSMSTTGPNAGRIVIAASCLSSYWDEYVAGAVMTYYPQKKKKSYFDGTFELHGDATCTAYSIKNGSEMDPCKSCGNLFGLKTTCEKEWPYGNCAEAESLSNLFRNDAEVKRKSRPTSDTCTPENRERAKDDTRRELTNTLQRVNFRWNGKYYSDKRRHYR